MPLFKRKPVEYLPVPESADTNAQVWYIPESGEVFLHYEDYLTRVTFYKKRLFSCESTGRLNLTFFEAVQSEQKAKQTVEERFPSLWTQSALEIIHYSTRSQNDLIDELYDFFRKNVFLDEIIFLDAPAYGNERTVQRGRILSRCTIDEVPALSKKEGVRSLLKPAVHSERIAAGMSSSQQGSEAGDDLESKEAFKVQLLSQSRRQFYVGFSQIRRDRLALSKQTFKRFIREMAIKDAWIGGVWQVKPELVQQYGLRTAPPEEILALAAAQAQKKRGKRKESVLSNKEGGDDSGTEEIKPKKRGRKILKQQVAQIQFPIEDTQLLQPSLLRLPKEGEPIVTRPALAFNFGGIGSDHVLALLQTWSFLVTYSRPLKLFPFTLDDFTAALKHPSDSEPYPDLIIETFGSLVKLACQDWANALAAANGGSHPSRVALPNLSDFGSEQHNTIPYAVIRTYEGLKPDDRVAIDQWYQWQPGQWNQTKSSSKKKKSSSMMTNASSRHRAWSVALAGLVKDRLPGDGPAGQLKWRVLACLLSRESESDIEAAEKSKQNDSNGSGKVVGDESGSPLTDLDELSNESKQNDVSQHDDDDDEDMEDELTVDSRRSSRRKVIKYYDDDEDEDDEWIPEETTMGTRSRPNTKATTTKAKNTRSSTSSTSTKKGSSSTTSFAFEEFCESSEQGFWSITPVDRLFLLRFLIEDCLADNDILRGYHEECHEKILELKREKRESVRDRKQLRQEMDEIEAAIRALYPEVEEGDKDEGLPGDEQNELASANGGKNRNSSIPMDISVSQMTDTSTVDASTHQAEGIDDLANTRHLSRVEKLKLEQARRNAAEAKKKEEFEKQKEFLREEKKKLDELKKLEDLERSKIRRENIIDYQLRMLGAVERYRCLGRDRYWNRYWWFDAGIGAYPFELVNQDFDEKVKTKSRIGPEAGPLVWASGCIFVEDYGLDRFHSPQAEAIQLGLVDGKWGHYATPEEVERLINWLDERGIREFTLRSNIDRVQVFIKGGMDKRIEQLNQELIHDSDSVRRSSRTASGASGLYLEYTNKWAKY